MHREVLNTKLNISRNKTFRVLLTIIIALSILSIASNASALYLPDYPFRDMFKDIFSVDSERSFPTFYSVYALQACALLIGVNAYITKARGGKFVRHWQTLSLIFVYLSFDEALSFHERATDPLKAYLNTGGLLHHAWVIPAGGLFCIFLVSYTKFVLALPNKIRNLFVVSCGIYVMGALGMEMIGGAVLGSDLPFAAYIITVACEEFFEMLGIVIFMYALLSHLKSQLIDVKVSFND